MYSCDGIVAGRPPSCLRQTAFGKRAIEIDKTTFVSIVDYEDEIIPST